MVAGQDAPPDLQLRVAGGRFERHLVTTIVALQVALAAIGVTVSGFVLLATDGLHPIPVGVALLSFGLAYILSYLYE
ncbi:hypothetical protein ACFQO4_19495 [Saliphagus sp. GCM10025334]|uniref:hypothetical protein n=1 Tax=Natronosalvus caseinilyticus TaxID=2953747 RepID=UPI0028B06131|nr:hypothetical protein [Natronosalvus caseinilyticus]